MITPFNKRLMRKLSTRVLEGNTGLKRPQRARRRIASKPVKLNGNESDSNVSLDENDTVKPEAAELEGNNDGRNLGKVEQRRCEFEEAGGEDSEPSVRGSVVEHNALSRPGEGLHRSTARASGSNNQGSEKLEIMVDPIQAMLLDMIPSLGTQPTRSADPVLKRESPIRAVGMMSSLEGKTSECADSIPKREMPTQGLNPERTKKKKVSYKDLANELLRDH